MFDLSNIDWDKCDIFGLKNKIKDVCNYWKEHREVNKEDITTTDLSKIFKFCISTIIKYLKKGEKLGWCNYNSKEEMKKSALKAGKKNGKKLEVFKNNKSEGIFESVKQLERDSKKIFGVKLLRDEISKVARGLLKEYKGFSFKYID